MQILLGISLFMRLLGPAAGYSLASICLKMYISPDLTPVIDNKDPRWLGMENSLFNKTEFSFMNISSRRLVAWLADLCCDFVHVFTYNCHDAKRAPASGSKKTNRERENQSWTEGS